MALADSGAFIQPITVRMAMPIKQKADFDRRFAKEWRRENVTAYDRHPNSRVRHWYLRVMTLKGAPAWVQISRVHVIMRESLKWHSDREIWGKRDYWATPTESLRVGSGDCEDATLLMATALRLLGWPPATLRGLFGLIDTPGGKRAHSVLEVIVGERHLRLDQRADAVYDAASPPGPFQQVYAIQFGVERDTALLSVGAVRRLPSRRPIN
jgi:predicted transglutaminase-like cysteine proteinase